MLGSSREQFPKRAIQSNSPDQGKTPEIKEQLNESLKLIGLYPNKAFFEDKAGKVWFFNADAEEGKGAFKEAELLDEDMTHVQFDTPELPIEQSEFKNKKEALEYVKMSSFKNFIPKGIADFTYKLMNVSEDFRPVFTEMLTDYKNIKSILDRAAAQTDPEERKKIEQEALIAFEEKYGTNAIAE